MEGISIREGRAEDLEAIRSFSTGTFEWGDYVPDEYLSWLSGPDTIALVATRDDDHPIAVARVGMLSPQEAWLSGARVHPEHRRRGIGSVMNDTGVEWARRRGAKVIRLATEETNVPARRQVEKLGYRSVANFSLAIREFNKQIEGSNGGRRLPGPERFDLAPAAEAEPAFMVWSTQQTIATSHGLFAADGWAFRRLSAVDVATAARGRQLWSCPSAWVIAQEEQREMWVPLLVTTPDDADRAARALVDLALEHEVTRLAAMVPRVQWLEEALARHYVAPSHPNLIYEKSL